MAAKYDRIRKLRYEGAVDADGHILEAADLWERYLEAKYKPMALRIKRDDRGTQYLEIAGHPQRSRAGRCLRGCARWARRATSIARSTS